jgi:hypothetical protein
VLHICRVPNITEASKPADRKSPSAIMLPPPVVAASDPSSLAAATPVGAGLVAYDYANARASAQ